jgi:hypothetical protein
MVGNPPFTGLEGLPVIRSPLPMRGTSGQQKHAENEVQIALIQN